MPRLFPFLACLLLALLPHPAGATTENYQQGVAAFEKKDWPAAREAFEAVIEQDQQLSTDLFFNLGNTLFRENQPGLAALWYRRALLLDPRDTAARQNLRLLQRRTGSLEFPTTTSHTVASWMKHRHWRRAVAATAWTATLALAARDYLRLQGPARSAAWILLALAVPATALAAWGATARLHPGEISRRAIVTQPSSSALAAPTTTAGIIIDHPPGTEVIIKEPREAWTYIEIPGQPARVGWVRSSALTPLWPYSPALIQ